MTGAPAPRAGERRVVLWLVRHGRTPHNASGLLRGHDDPPLDEVGCREAQAAAEHLARLPLERVLSSPLARARQTAAPIADQHHLTVEIDRRLIDRDYGPWTGVSEAEVRERFGSLDSAEGVESVAAMHARIDEFLTAMTSTGAGSHIAVVAHDAINRQLLGSILGVSQDDLDQPTGCINQLVFAHGAWRAVDLALRPDGRGRP
jgi:broad specificity phosphatase PhoE